jgi:hypothetical protein
MSAMGLRWVVDACAFAGPAVSVIAAAAARTRDFFMANPFSFALLNEKTAREPNGFRSKNLT